MTITEQFARSMSLEEALSTDNLLCYEMNGEPPFEHGFPVRPIAPGWYGVANVKWLTRIEVRSQRYAGRFMARDYVTIREEERDGETVWTFATVSHDRLKSALPRSSVGATSTQSWAPPGGHRSDGWRSESTTDPGCWPAQRHQPQKRRSAEFAWTFWKLDWGTFRPRARTRSPRAFDVDGHQQPPPMIPSHSKRTYWESNGQITRRVTIP